MVRRRDRAWEVIHPLLLLTGAVIIGFVCVLFATGVDQAGAAGWVERFSTSPGAAGVAAVVAAGIGFWAIARQLRHNKGVERDAAWWKSFEWVTDRALPRDEADRLPYLVAVDMLAPLVDSASNATQERICGAFLDHLATLGTVVEAAEMTEPSTPTSPPSDDGTEHADDPPSPLVTRIRKLPNTFVSYRYDDLNEVRARSTLENYAKLTADGAGRSLAVEAQLYNLQVTEAVSRISGTDFDVLPGSDSSHVIAVSREGARVRIFPSTATSLMAATGSALSILLDSEGGGLVVTRAPIPKSGLGRTTPVADRAFVTRWRDERDDEDLRLAILHAFSTPPPRTDWRLGA